MELTEIERARLLREFVEPRGQTTIPGDRRIEWNTVGEDLWAEVTYEERFDYDSTEMRWSEGWPSYTIIAGFAEHREEAWPDSFADALIQFVEYVMTHPRRK